MAWERVAGKLKVPAPRLSKGEQRVLCLSCCYSRKGFDHMRDHLKGHFSGRYFLDKKEVSFAEAMTVGSMFYFKARRKKPHDAKLRKAINCYFGCKKVLCFKKI